MIKPLVSRSSYLLAGAAFLIAVPLLDDTRVGSAPTPAGPAPCRALAALAGQARDAGSTLQACLDATPSGGSVALQPGRYQLSSPVVIRRAVALTTQDTTQDTPRCSNDERRCAVLHLAIAFPAPLGTVMPFEIDANGVRVDRLVFEGTRRSDPRLSVRRCASDTERSVAGGVRINGGDVTIRRSVFRDMACYTALEYGTGSDVTIADNDFVSNGTHTANLRWADGLTIHTGLRFKVTGNRFIDNTDVQLIFGSCVDCVVTRNSFRHSPSAEGGSFAEMMLHAWPKATSGDFTGTRVSDNDIDCGAMRRCGFGIMIGSAPWYVAPTFGGSVTDNRVSRAMLALNVDRLTGPMTIDRNRLMATDGTYPGNCGPQRIAGISANISPVSRPFVQSGEWLHPTTNTSYCILNYDVKNTIAVPTKF